MCLNITSSFKVLMLASAVICHIWTVLSCEVATICELSKGFQSMQEIVDCRKTHTAASQPHDVSNSPTDGYIERSKA